MQSSFLLNTIHFFLNHFWVFFISTICVFLATALGEYYVRNLRREVKKREKVEARLKKEKQKLLTLKNQIQHKNERLEAILSSMGEGMLVSDKKGKIVLVNQCGSTIMRVSPKDLIGTSIDTLMHFVSKRDVDSRSSYCDLVQSVVKDTNIVTVTPTDDFYCQRVGAGDVPITMVIAPLLTSGKNNGVITLFRDGTQEKEVDEMKNTFVSFASHQLRTPLTGIRWYAKELLGSDVGRITKKQRVLIAGMYESTKHMITLVNDLLNVSRVESGKLRISPEPIDLSSFVHDVVVDAAPLLAAKEDTAPGAEIVYNNTLGTFAPIMIDGTLLRQVIHNFLTNAIKYSNAIHTGDISVSLSKDKHGWFVVSVIDHGIGIAKSEQMYVFDKFFRAQNASEVTMSGTGLGLYVAKLVVEDAGCTLGFHSIKGKGSTFFVTIPPEGMVSKDGTRELSV